MLKRVPGFLLVLTAAFLAANCSKGPSVDEHAAKNANEGNANNQDQSVAVAPYAQPTLTGDIERISLAISMARDAVKLNKPQEAVTLLQTAQKEVGVALGRKPRLSDEFEALKTAIDRTIPAVESKGKDAEARLTELQTRIGAIKMNTFAR